MASVIPSIEEGTWFTALDVNDAYFHIDIHPSQRRFLRFLTEQDHY